jgi:cystathionine gamma-synthase
MLKLPLGVSLPPRDEHAVSVSIPKWDHVIGYETGDPMIHKALSCGYPRFFRHPQVVKLTTFIKDTFFRSDSEDEEAWEIMALPTKAVAERLRTFLGDSDVQAHHILNKIWVVRFPEHLAKKASLFWQHTGEIVSSRYAVCLLDLLNSNNEYEIKLSGTSYHSKLCQRISELYFTNIKHSSDVFLYPSGMAAIFASVRLMSSLKPNAKSILVGFPYLDTLKILHRPEWCEAGVYFFPACGKKEMSEIAEILSREPILGVFTEFPGNPLLSCPDLLELSRLAHRNGTALIVDDTIGSYNINVLANRVADIAVTSLTKIFSGTSNVMGGSMVLNPSTPLYEQLKNQLTPDNEVFIFEEDAKVLLDSSEDLHTRLARVNASASYVAQRLREHPRVKSVYYPNFEHFQELLKKPGSDQHGPILSVVLHGGEAAAKSFFDALDLAKGPSLGTNFTLCCPYTLLAHFFELDYVESCGVDRNLVRFSIGLEDQEAIWSAIETALNVAVQM